MSLLGEVGDLVVALNESFCHEDKLVGVVVVVVVVVVVIVAVVVVLVVVLVIIF